MRVKRAASATVITVLALLLAVLLLSGCDKQSSTVPAVEGSSPSLVMEKINEALAKLSAARAKLESMTAQAPGGTPPPSAEVTAGGGSGGQDASKASVPSVVGMSYGAALSTVSEYGFGFSASETYSENVGAGLVCSQSPAPGSLAARGSTVSVAVSLGSAWTTCPSCGGAGSAVIETTCPECGGTGWCYT